MVDRRNDDVMDVGTGQGAWEDDETISSSIRDMRWTKAREGAELTSIIGIIVK